jgi:Holliday junction DNA helicase RuvA
MIGYLTGTIIHQDLKTVVLDVNGVGYKVHTNTGAIVFSTEAEKKISFWTHLAVRENALDLYGFVTQGELRMFELLMTVSGIGPKSALSVLVAANSTLLRQAIVSGDTTHLTKISGIGKKVAEKIVLELKDKINDEDGGSIILQSTSGEVDALEALKTLGYNERDAREALKKVIDVPDASEKVRKALKILS